MVEEILGLALPLWLVLVVIGISPGEPVERRVLSTTIRVATALRVLTAAVRGVAPLSRPRLLSVLVVAHSPLVSTAIAVRLGVAVSLRGSTIVSSTISRRAVSPILVELEFNSI